MSTRSYLSFTRRERIGILTLILIILIVAVLPHFIPKQAPPLENIPLAQLEKKKPDRDPAAYIPYDSFQQGEYTYRKNHQHREYGSREDSYHNSYGKGSGGRNNFRRYYPAGKEYSTEHKEERAFNHDRHIYNNSARQDAERPRPRYVPIPVDINTADTTAFINLPGIGSKLAARIVSFRSRLGGFSSVDQIREVYGLRDTVFLKLMPYLRCDSLFVRKPLLSYNTP